MSDEEFRRVLRHFKELAKGTLGDFDSEKSDLYERYVVFCHRMGIKPAYCECGFQVEFYCDGCDQAECDQHDTSTCNKCDGQFCDNCDGINLFFCQNCMTNICKECAAPEGITTCKRCGNIYCSDHCHGENEDCFDGTCLEIDPDSSEE